MTIFLKIVFLVLTIGVGIGLYFLFKYIFAPNYNVEPGVSYQQEIFTAGEHGYYCYRIPALLALPDDNILAFCEARKNSCSDYGNIDLVMKKSSDAGRTWSDMQVLWDAGELAVQNPMPVYDEDTGQILLGCMKDRTETYIFKSSDDGITWSAPEHLSKVKPSNWNILGVAPGHGIVLESGRILVAGMSQKNETWQSHCIYSDDHGKSWTLGYVFEEEFNECLAVELSNGNVMMILRRNRHLSDEHYVFTSISKDGGETFDEPKPNLDLITPVCQASICQFTTDDAYERNRLLFSNPSSFRRNMMTIKCSYDDGKHWDIERLLYPGPTAYSDLAVLSNNVICCLFENGRRGRYERLTFIQFDLEWLVRGTDSLQKK